MQSIETHQLQQTLRDSANQQVRMYSPTPTIVETVQESGSDDSLEEYQDSMEAVNPGDEV